jgi:hypothetical protein
MRNRVDAKSGRNGKVTTPSHFGPRPDETASLQTAWRKTECVPIPPLQIGPVTPPARKTKTRPEYGSCSNTFVPVCSPSEAAPPVCGPGSGHRRAIVVPRAPGWRRRLPASADLQGVFGLAVPPRHLRCRRFHVPAPDEAAIRRSSEANRSQCSPMPNHS